MITDELQRFYDGIAVDPEVERRVIAAVTGRPARQRSRLAVFGPIAVAAAVIVIAVLLAVLPGGGGAHTQPVGPQPTVAVIPPKAPGTISGAVLRNGHPLRGAQILIQAWPNSTIASRAKVGSTVRTGAVGNVVSDAHGSYVIHVPQRVLIPRYLEGGDWLNVEVDVFSSTGHTSWNAPIHFHGGRTQPMRFVFDLGKRTVTVNGHTSKAPVG